jgi:hypothetical protein
MHIGDKYRLPMGYYPDGRNRPKVTATVIELYGHPEQVGAWIRYDTGAKAGMDIYVPVSVLDRLERAELPMA